LVNEEKEIAGEPVESGEETEFSEEESGKFAFAMAPVVRVIKEELDNDKIVRRRVKEEMNLWLEKLCRKIARKMNKSEYTVVELDDFKTAIEPYELIEDVEGERHRLQQFLHGHWLGEDPRSTHVFRAIDDPEVLRCRCSNPYHQERRQQSPV